MSLKLIELLSDEEIEVLHQIFDFLDKDGKGEINISELIQELKRFGYDKSNPNEFSMIKLLETGRNQKITFPTFLDGITNKFSKQESKEEDLRKMFNLLDTSKSGKINFQDLEKLSKEIGDNFQKEELKELIKHIGENDSITFDVFSCIINNDK